MYIGVNIYEFDMDDRVGYSNCGVFLNWVVRGRGCGCCPHGFESPLSLRI